MSKPQKRVISKPSKKRLLKLLKISQEILEKHREIFDKLAKEEESQEEK